MEAGLKNNKTQNIEKQNLPNKRLHLKSLAKEAKISKEKPAQTKH